MRTRIDDKLNLEISHFTPKNTLAMPRPFSLSVVHTHSRTGIYVPPNSLLKSNHLGKGQGCQVEISATVSDALPLPRPPMNLFIGESWQHSVANNFKVLNICG